MFTGLPMMMQNLPVLKRTGGEHVLSPAKWYDGGHLGWAIIQQKPNQWRACQVNRLLLLMAMLGAASGLCFGPGFKENPYLFARNGLAFQSASGWDDPLTIKGTEWVGDCDKRAPLPPGAGVPFECGGNEHNHQVVEFKGDGSLYTYNTQPDWSLWSPALTAESTGTWKQEGTKLIVERQYNGLKKPFKSEWTLINERKQIITDGGMKLEYRSKLSTRQERPEKTIELVNMHRDAKIVEIRDGATEDCEEAAYVTTIQVLGGEHFILACGHHGGFCVHWKWAEVPGDKFGAWSAASCSDHLFDEKTQRKVFKY